VDLHATKDIWAFVSLTGVPMFVFLRFRARQTLGLWFFWWFMRLSGCAGAFSLVTNARVLLWLDDVLCHAITRHSKSGQLRRVDFALDK
jgi:hypothetical protein